MSNLVSLSPVAAIADRGRRLVPIMLAAGIVATLVYFGWMAVRIVRDPRVVFLTPAGNADWIQADEPVSLERKWVALQARGFRKTYTLQNVPTDAVLEVRATQRFSVSIDGAVVAIPPADVRASKALHRVQLAPHLQRGTHVLTIFAQNDFGPIALWASCDALGLHTDPSWESTTDGVSWRPVRLASDRRPHANASKFGSPRESFLRGLPVFGLIFAATVALLLLRDRVPRVVAPLFQAANVRWLVMAAWVVLAMNNIMKLPSAAGFDVSAHFEYVDYILQHRRIPFASEGWQMFQSPLNYILLALLHLALPKFEEISTTVLILRLLPLTCGLLQIQICYSAAKRVFPERNDLQILGTIFAGVLPMNIYISQYVSNEPLAGVLSAAVLALALKLVRPLPGERLTWTPVWLGITFGLALLSKVSAVVVGVPLALAIAGWTLGAGTNLKAGLVSLARHTAVIGAIVFAVCGWYYVRNWMHLGRPFVGGWDPSRGFAWWQDPGFRTLSEYFTFGAALSRPILVGIESFWDGVYASFWSDTFVSSALDLASAPKWNFDYVFSALWFALLPTLALVAGAGIAVVRAARDRDAAWLVILACAGAYFLALLHFTLTVPFYCVVKSFYTLGALPAYMLLFLAGYHLLVRRGSIALISHGLFACWAVSSYVAYFSGR